MDGKLARYADGLGPDSNGFFIERFLAETEKNRDNTSSSFHGKDGEIHLVGHLRDVFSAGTDTTATLLEWLLLYMGHYSDIQEQLYSEIVAAIDTNSNISIHVRSHSQL